MKEVYNTQRYTPETLLEAIVSLVYPEAAWEYDIDGQLVIYTGHYWSKLMPRSRREEEQA